MKGYGIVSYGVSIPKWRLPVDETLAVWRNSSPELIKDGQGVIERGVLGFDEDSNTYAIEAVNESIERNPSVSKVNALFYGTCTNPYDSRPSSTIIIEACDYDYSTLTADVQFSGKSGTTAMIMASGMVGSGLAEKAVAVAADTINRHTSPGDLTEPYAGCGGAAFVLGTENVIATIDGYESYCTDLSDNFRVEGERYIRSGMLLGQAKNDVGVYDHVINSGTKLMKKMNTKPEDYKYIVAQQTTPAVAYRIGQKLCFSKEQVAPSIFSETIGDTGAASILIGLAKVLDRAKAGEKILVVSYGFGAGSDAISLTVTDSIGNMHGKVATVDEHVASKMMIDYPTATKNEFKYIRPSHPINAYL